MSRSYAKEKHFRDDGRVVMHMTKIDGQKARDDASRLISHLGPGGNTNLGDGIIKGLDVGEAYIKSNFFMKTEQKCPSS